MMKYVMIILIILLSCDQSDHITKKEHMVLSILYVQQSAEYRALTHQAYNLATIRLQKELQKKTSLPKAVVVDIDETILDNSNFNAELVLNNLEYSSKLWAKWSEKAIADTIPGALSFLRFADKNSFNIFYVSNRKTNELRSTMKNLNKFKFPQVIESRFLLQDETSSKTSRRDQISKSNDIILFIGDNLNDFSDRFEKISNSERRTEVDKIRSELADRFVIIPNPFYGEWESALYDYNYSLNPKQKYEKRLNLLKTHMEK